VLVTALLALICAPLFAQAPGKAWAQELVDRTAARHPKLLAVVLHAATAGGRGPVIVASTIGRIGTPASDDERQVMASGAPSARATSDGRRIDVTLPLLDTTGITVGILGLSLPKSPDETDAMAVGRAGSIRDWLARSILNARNLLEPHPFVSGVTTKTRAQKLVDDIVASERMDLRAVTLRGFSGGQLMVLGSTFGRHGKKGDDDDLKVLNSSEPETGLHVDGKRFNVDMSLRDATGRPIGTLTVGYAYRDGVDTKALVGRALQSRERVLEGLGADGALDALDL